MLPYNEEDMINTVSKSYKTPFTTLLLLGILLVIYGWFSLTVLIGLPNIDFSSLYLLMLTAGMSYCFYKLRRNAQKRIRTPQQFLILTWFLIVVASLMPFGVGIIFLGGGF